MAAKLHSMRKAILADSRRLRQEPALYETQDFEPDKGERELLSLVFRLGLFIVALQTALIHWQHFSPFERESNLRAVLWGAKPTPRYWAVVALDLCAVALAALLVLSVWPQSPNDLPTARLARILPAWILVALLAARCITLSPRRSFAFQTIRWSRGE